MNTIPIVDRQLDTVYRIACVQTRHTADAEDITQEVFLEYARRQPTFASPEHETAWFIRVTMHRCKNLFKTAWRRHVSFCFIVDNLAHYGVGNILGASREFAYYRGLLTG
ncbi:MAG: hypothetical protein FWE06_00545 [Oscillospiraceae bacterium]|nr:hypothetical protein [Oscillospiraceae bacterium]